MAHSFTQTRASALLISSAIAALSLSSLAGADQPGAESFQGTCEMSGAIRHQPPLTQDPAATRFHGSFSGVCSGRLTDRDGETHQLDGAPAEYDGRGVGELSCLGGIT